MLRWSSEKLTATFTTFRPSSAKALAASKMFLKRAPKPSRPDSGTSIPYFCSSTLRILSNIILAFSKL